MRRNTRPVRHNETHPPRRPRVQTKTALRITVQQLSGRVHLPRTIHRQRQHLRGKELCNANIQEEPRNRLFLPINSTIIPCHPTNEIPAEIHERLVIKHNKCLDSLMQNSISGMNWHQAESRLQISSDSNFAKAFPSLPPSVQSNSWT
jgi:hypothetical protein